MARNELINDRTGSEFCDVFCKQLLFYRLRRVPSRRTIFLHEFGLKSFLFRTPNIPVKLVLGVVITTSRSSHQRCSIRKGVLRNFAKFTGKHLCQSLFFNEVAVLRHATFLKKGLWRRCFPVNFKKILRTLFLQNTS